MSSTSGALEAIERISTRAATRTTSSARSSPRCTPTGLRLGRDLLRRGGRPRRSAPKPARPTRRAARSVPVTWQGDRSPSSRSTARPRRPRASSSASPSSSAGHCLVGWDTGGESWDPETSEMRAARPVESSCDRAPQLSCPLPSSRCNQARPAVDPSIKGSPGVPRPIPRSRERHGSTPRAYPSNGVTRRW